MVDAIVMLYACHCVIAYCSSMLFIYCMYHSTCYLEVCMVDAIVMLYAAHCVIAYCSSMLFIYCM